jgi:hypothetical protein
MKKPKVLHPKSKSETIVHYYGKFEIHIDELRLIGKLDYKIKCFGFVKKKSVRSKIKCFDLRVRALGSAKIDAGAWLSGNANFLRFSRARPAVARVHSCGPVDAFKSPPHRAWTDPAARRKLAARRELGGGVVRA